MKKLDLSQPVQTRNGVAARIICCDAKGPFPIIALIPNGSRESSYCFDLSGSFANGFNSEMDLVNVPRTFKAVRWFVVDKHGGVFTYANHCHALASEHIAIKRVEVELTENEGLFTITDDQAQQLINNSR